MNKKNAREKAEAQGMPNKSENPEAGNSNKGSSDEEKQDAPVETTKGVKVKSDDDDMRRQFLNVCH